MTIHLKNISEWARPAAAIVFSVQPFVWIILLFQFSKDRCRALIRTFL
jgi:hypothetical protein